MSICKKCNSDFTVDDRYNKLFDSFNLGHPDICHLCSWKQKLQWQNEYKIYKAKCAACGESMISIYSNPPFLVYKREIWLKDDWELPSFTYDKNRSFWDQYWELFDIVPRPNVIQVNVENSEYAHLMFDSKNCYLSFQAFQCDRLICCYRSISLRDSANSFFCSDSELLHECANCQNSCNLQYCSDSENCHDSAFLYDCRGCGNCFMSWNLRNKEYYFMNERCGKEEYEEKLKEYDISTKEGLERARQKFDEFKKNFIVRSAYMVNCEGCNGDYLVNCKNCDDSYFTNGSEDCSCILRGTEMKDTYDSAVGGLAEVSYNILQLGWCYHSAFSNTVNRSNECMFCENCDNCQECVGCIGLRRGKYMILNKEYSEDEYFDLKKHIVNEIREQGSEMRFFDVEKTPFDYSETIADLYFPNEEGDVSDEAVGLGGSGEGCKNCGKAFNISGAEASFYKKHKIVPPDECFYCRIKRLAVPYSVVKMRKVKCSNCDKEVHAPDIDFDFGKKYCEECYLKEVY